VTPPRLGQSDPLLTVEDLMRILHLKSPSGVSRWLRRNQVPFSKPGRKFYVYASAITAALQRREMGNHDTRATANLRRVF
jgi:hypothetical protein